MEELTKFPKQRMYTLTIYQLTGIQKGIQAAHAIMELSRKKFADDDFLRWIRHDKTIVILNGGTTNSEGIDIWSQDFHAGDMEGHMAQLETLGIKYEPFFEPDLNNSLTAIAFLVDEKVWNQEKYPRPFYGRATGNKSWDERKSLEYAVQETGIPAEVWKFREFLSQFKLATN